LLRVANKPCDASHKIGTLHAFAPSIAAERIKNQKRRQWHGAGAHGLACNTSFDWGFKSIQIGEPMPAVWVRKISVWQSSRPGQRVSRCAMHHSKIARTQQVHRISTDLQKRS
jgi:hypothetical protein